MFPRLPDWLVYAVVVAALLWAATARRERADAPPAPPPPDAEEGALIGPPTPFDPLILVEAGQIQTPTAGTAFALSQPGEWLTARHVVDGCRLAALMVGPDQAIEAAVRISPNADVALLRTEGGPTPLPLAIERPLRIGQRAFHLGYPQGQPGEVTSRLLGRETLRVVGRGAREEPVLAWAEVGRTAGLRGTLQGLSGAPALDGQGRVLGVTVAEAPRRGRVYTTAPETVRATLTMSVRRGGAEVARGEPLTVENYGRVADKLRRELRVAQVVCLKA